MSISFRMSSSQVQRIFEGIVSYYDKEYAFHEYGHDKEAGDLMVRWFKLFGDQYLGFWVLGPYSWQCTVFMPAMRRLSPAYDEYMIKLKNANQVFSRHFQK